MLASYGWKMGEQKKVFEMVANGAVL